MSFQDRPFITILIALAMLTGACYGDRLQQAPGASYTRPIQKYKNGRNTLPAGHVTAGRNSDHSSQQEHRSPQQILDEAKALMDKSQRYGDYLRRLHVIWLGLPLGSAQKDAIYNEAMAGYDRLDRMGAQFNQLMAEFDRAVARSTPSEPAPSHSMPLDPTRSSNDCAIIASQAYGRLKTSASWAQVIGFDMLINGERRGHAAVVFKYQGDGPVFYYDAAGTIQLRTAGTGVSDIEAAVSDSCRYPVSGMRFLTL
jgi:hypothetical protein